MSESSFEHFGADTSPQEKTPKTPPQTEQTIMKKHVEVKDGIIIPPEFSGLVLGQEELIPSTVSGDILCSQNLEETDKLNYIHTSRFSFKEKKEFDEAVLVYTKTLQSFLNHNNIIGISFKVDTGIRTQIANVQGDKVFKITTEFKLGTGPKISAITPTIKYFHSFGDQEHPDYASGDELISKLQTINPPLKYFGKTDIISHHEALAVGGRFDILKTTAPSAPTIETKKEKIEKKFAVMGGTVEIGNDNVELSSDGARVRSIYYTDTATGKREQIGSIVKCEAKEKKSREPKTMFLTSASAPKRTPPLFNIDTQGNSFPNVEAINKYIQEGNKGKKRKLTMISTGPTFEYERQNIMTGVNYANGLKVGHETETAIQDTRSKTNGRGIASIAGGKMELLHTSGTSNTQVKKRINEGRDIMTMSCAFNNGVVNAKANSLWSNKNTHSIVEFTDGNTGEVIINFDNPTLKQEIYQKLGELKFALYADSDRHNDYLDGIRYNTPKGIVYSNPRQQDVFTGRNGLPTKEEKDNMPGVVVHYIEQK